MSEVRIPQGGLRKPRSKYPVQMGSRTEESIEALGHGWYRWCRTMQNRCSQPMQVGSAAYCVVDDFGFLAPIDWEWGPR